jgi:hypothetical protein
MSLWFLWLKEDSCCKSDQVLGVNAEAVDVGFVDLAGFGLVENVVTLAAFKGDLCY